MTFREDCVDGLVDTAEVARRFGVQAKTVTRWGIRSRTGRLHPPIPKPEADRNAGPVWWWADWIAWAAVFRGGHYLDRLSRRSTRPPQPPR